MVSQLLILRAAVYGLAAGAACFVGAQIAHATPGALPLLASFVLGAGTHLHRNARDERTRSA
jgi:hypothetical protein